MFFTRIERSAKAGLALVLSLAFLLSGCVPSKEATLAATDVEEVQEAESSSRDFSALELTISDFETTGYHIGVAVCSAEDGTELYTYNQDELFYPASAIKGPFAVALFEHLGDGYEKSTSLVRPMIESSDNEAYDVLRETYGSSFFFTFAKDAGIQFTYPTSENAWKYRYYPNMSAKDMALLWTHARSYFVENSPGAQTLRTYFVEREVSVFKDLDAESITKAGWYPASALAATGESGLVSKAGAQYVVSIMTNMPSNVEHLEPVANALMEAL